MTVLYTFLILSGFWILLSGNFDAFHLILGALSCGLVSFLSHDLLFQKRDEKGRLATAWRFVLYLPWLFWQIFLANLHVASLALHPRASDHLDPRIIRFKSKLKKDIARVTLANSITLTPGTITVHVLEDGEFVVHAITPKAAGDLSGEFQGEMEKRIAWIFKEEGR